MEKTTPYLPEPAESTAAPKACAQTGPIPLVTPQPRGRAKAQTSGGSLCAKTHPLLLAKGDGTLSCANKHNCSQGIGALPASPATLCYQSRHCQGPQQAAINQGQKKKANQ